MKNSFEQKNTIIYGGAFSPPTRAHQSILQACVDKAESIDADVWIMPSGERADKSIGVDRERRLDMVRALANDVVRRDVELSIITTEMDRFPVQTETYDTVQELNQLHPDRRFIWVYGSDSIDTMPSWKGGEWLIDTVPMLVIERPGTPILSLGRYASRLSVDTINTSSTEVRARMKQHLPVADLVPPSVLALLVD